MERLVHIILGGVTDMEFSITVIKVDPSCLISQKTVFTSVVQSSSEESIKKNA